VQKVLRRQDHLNTEFVEYLPRLASPKVGIDKIQIGHPDLMSPALLINGQVYRNFRFTATVVPYQYNDT
jgi:hypothetical protein